MNETRVSLDGLNELYRPPHAIVMDKVLDRLDPHARSFLEMSPFCVLATGRGGGSGLDASPRGGSPGFVKAPDDVTLLLPDRPGNNRLDSLRNIVAGDGQVATIFFIPGIDETLRINGVAEVVDDPVRAGQFVEFGKPPRSLLKIHIAEVFLHCAKALVRSRLWDPAGQKDRSILPPLAQIIREQIGPEKAGDWGTPEYLSRARDHMKDGL